MKYDPSDRCPTCGQPRPMPTRFQRLRAQIERELADLCGARAAFYREQIRAIIASFPPAGSIPHSGASASVFSQLNP